MKHELTIKKSRSGWFAVYAGAAKLSKGFRKQADAEAELEANRSFYRYWAGSASVSFENRVAAGDFVEIVAG